MRFLLASLSVALVILAGCRTVQQHDLDAWVGMPVEALDTHTFFVSLPMYRSITAGGIEVRNYTNTQERTRCTGTTTMTCTSVRDGCNNIFYIKDGKVIEYVPTGRCFTNESMQPQARYLRLRNQ